MRTRLLLWVIVALLLVSLANAHHYNTYNYRFYGLGYDARISGYGPYGYGYGDNNYISQDYFIPRGYYVARLSPSYDYTSYYPYYSYYYSPYLTNPYRYSGYGSYGYNMMGYGMMNMMQYGGY